MRVFGGYVAHERRVLFEEECLGSGGLDNGHLAGFERGSCFC